jgi:peptide/nickel transport system substrate-binding protein
VRNLERAREEMALGGHPVRRVGDRWVAEGIPDDIEYWAGEGDTGKQYGELAQSDLAQIGIHVRLKQVSFATWLEETGKPNRARIFLSGWNMDFPDPSNFLDVLFHTRSIAEQNSSNRSFYSNPELDGILDRAKIEPDREARRQLYRRASEIIVADSPWAFMWSDLQLEAWQPYVRGYRPNPVFSNDYRHVWLDLPKQRFAIRRARTFESITLAFSRPRGAGR